MARLNITKPTGNVDSLNLISAFKAENNTYVVLDSEKMGSMGLPIIYISKYTTKLEKINNDMEWQSVKNYLKGIISGTNFEYVKIGDNLTADEAYYTPLTLPQNSFDAIKNRYVITETPAANEMPTETVIPARTEASPVMPNPSTTSNATVNVSPVTPPQVEPTAEPQQESVMNLIDEAYRVSTPAQASSVAQNVPSMPNMESTPSSAVTPSSVIPTMASNPAPTMPQAYQVTPQPVAEAPVVNPAPVRTESPVVTPVAPAPSITNVTNVASSIKMPTINFDNDKETFLKACENMFDALVSKYQKELTTLEQKEQELKQKEVEINAKLRDASEHLANAEAKETVANIAHDNAKKVMELNNFMPVNPNN